MNKILAFLLLALPAQAFELREIDLIPLESHYSNTLDLTKPLYRLGEVLQLTYDPDQLVLVVGYHFENKQWRYELRKCHWNPALLP